MKPSLHSVLTAAAFAAAFASVSAQEPTAPPPPRPPHHPDGEAMKPIAFLGVGTSITYPALGDQLGLPPDTGLLVMDVAPGSPADGHLKRNDVLTKLDDQLLVEPRQFASLIRMHHKGDSVTLTYIRGGKTATVAVQLAEHTAPHHMIIKLNHAGTAMHDGVQKTVRIEHVSGDPMSTDGHLSIKDDQLSLELTVAGGKKTLVATDASGTQLFSGPIDTPEQRKSLPPEVASRLQRIEHIHYNEDGPSPEVRAQSMVMPPKAPRSAPAI